MKKKNSQQNCLRLLYTRMNRGGKKLNWSYSWYNRSFFKCLIIFVLIEFNTNKTYADFNTGLYVLDFFPTFSRRRVGLPTIGRVPDKDDAIFSKELSKIKNRGRVVNENNIAPESRRRELST